jgi:hypothetical protein
MSVVRCPSCERALILPEASDAATAKCPLCGRVFDLPSHEPVPVGPPTSAPSGVQTDPSALPPVHHYHDSHEPFLPAADLGAIDSATRWLRAAGALGMLHLLLCDCFSCCLALPWGDEGVVVLLFAAGWLLEAVVSLTALHAAGSLELLGSRWLLRPAGVLCLVMVVLESLLTAPVVRALANSARGAPGRNAVVEAAVFAVILLFDAALVLTFLVAGLKALGAQGRPDGRDRFGR